MKVYMNDIAIAIGLAQEQFDADTEGYLKSDKCEEHCWILWVAPGFGFVREYWCNRCGEHLHCNNDGFKGESNMFNEKGEFV